MDVLRKRLSYQSGHRGTKELDILLGRFAMAHLDGMSDNDLNAYAALLEVEEHTLFAWLTGVDQPPAEHKDMVAMIRAALLKN